MGLNLLVSTIIIGLVVGRITSTFWLSYTLLLILLGGLLVIFIYVALLARNDKFTFDPWFFIFFPIRFVSFLFYTQETKNTVRISFNYDIYFWLNKLFSSDLFQLTLFLVIYLFVTLIVVVYNTKFVQAPLRLYK